MLICYGIAILCHYYDAIMILYDYTIIAQVSIDMTIIS